MFRGRAVFHAPNLAWARKLKVEVVERWSASQQSEWLETALEGGLACWPRPLTQPKQARAGAVLISG